MNRDSVIAKLLEYLSEFLYHDLMFSELIDLIAKTGQEKKFFSQLVIRLRHLSCFGVQAETHDGFENIGKGLFSMHFEGKEYNIRILFSFMPNGQPALLLSFYEREGKRKTDYTHLLEPAISRLKQMKEDYIDE